MMDKIAVSYQAGPKVSDIFVKNQETIRKEVLADTVSTESLSGYKKDWNINGEQVTLEVKKQS